MKQNESDWQQLAREIHQQDQLAAAQAEAAEQAVRAKARHDRMISRRRHVAAAAVLITAASYGTWKGLEAVDTNDNSDRVARNTQTIENAKEFTSNTIILKSGVKLRTSPAFQNGDNNTGTESNIAKVIPQGKSLEVRQAIIGKDGWIAFDTPMTESAADISTKDMAESLVYVNTASLEEHSPDKITEIDESPNHANGIVYTDSNGHVKTFHPGHDTVTPELITARELPVIE